MIYRISVIAVMFGLLFTACSTTVSEGQIPADASAKQILQKGLDKLSNEEFDLARSYFDILIRKFPDDRAAVLEAKYNTGVSYVREKNMEKAKSYLTEYLAQLTGDSPADKQFTYLSQQLLLQTEAPVSPGPSSSPGPTASASPSPKN